MRQGARSALAAGVTTLRDTGDAHFFSLRLRDELRRMGPTLVCCGPPLTIPNGHCDFLGGVVVPEQPIPKIVDEYKARGADQIKVMVSGGILTKYSSPMALQFGTKELAEITREAHRHRMLVAAHAHSREAIHSSILANVDSIEHCTFQTTEDWKYCATDADIANVASSQIAVSPTLCEREGVKQSSARLRWRMDLVGRLHAAGARIAAGTDAGVLPGLSFDSLPYAIETLVKSGFQPWDAIKAATAESAAVVGRRHSIGSLEIGKTADILIVEGNPLEDIAALRNVVAVFVAGNQVSSGAFS